MLDQISTTGLQPIQEIAAVKPRKVLHMVKNERMGGYIPEWRTVTTSSDKVEQTLTQAANIKGSSFESALAYNAANIDETPPHLQEFGFSDLADMANPLHHIPVVGHLYREITGDEIKPIGNIIGGALYGGAAGAAAGITDAVIREETGKNLTENTIDFALRGKKPAFKHLKTDNPLTKLQQVQNNLETNAYNNLPASLLSFTNTAQAYQAQDAARITIERLSDTSGSNEKASGLYALANS